MTGGVFVPFRECTRTSLLLLGTEYYWVPCLAWSLEALALALALASGARLASGTGREK